MGKLIISENVSLDGIAAGAPLLDWVGQIKGEAAEVLADEARTAQALLLGRRSYDFFAGRWPARSGEYADRLNSMPKYVVSGTLEHPAWSNTTVLAGDVVRAVTQLKRELAGDVVVYGSVRLVQTLIEHDLADEVRLMIYPVVLGAGGRLFEATSDKLPMRLAGVRAVGDGLAFLTYQRVQDA